MSMVDTDLRDLIAGLLEENRLKPPRVQANVVVQLIESYRPPSSPEVVAAPKPTKGQRDPARWVKYAERNAALLDEGIATTRNRTVAAMAALGLDPVEVRAVVIEPNVIHVFRWTDAGERLGVGVPILDLEETA